MSENKDNENQQQQDAGKEEKKYQQALAKVVALLGSEDKLNPSNKVGGDAISKIVEELTKEDTERISKEVKEELQKVIQTNVDFKKAVKQKRQELEQLEKTKKKEFVEAANKLFAKVENIGQIQRDFEASLREVDPANQSTVLNTGAALQEEGKEASDEKAQA